MLLLHLLLLLPPSQDLEGITADRDEETRNAGEQQMTAIVRTNARKERAGLERLLVLESALRDVANASAQSLVDLQSKLDQVRVHVQVVHSLGVLEVWSGEF